MNKGFTLIELLSVIAILAIIILIATPIVLDIIENIKEDSLRIRVENYLGAVELTLAKQTLNNSSEKISGNFQIIENGRKIKSLETNKEMKVEFDGEGLTEGIIVVENGSIKKIDSGRIDNLFVKIILGKVRLFERLPESTLVSGSDFNVRIKTLANGEEKTSTYADQIVTSIQFLSNGKLPEEYSLKELQEFEQIDVSKNEDGSILAISDGKGNIFIYSEDLILFSSDSSYMFNEFYALENLIFGQIDTNKIENMSYIFRRCRKLTNINLNSFETNSVINMFGMFAECSGLTTLDTSKLTTTNVTNMGLMFFGCSKLTSLNLVTFDTSNVTNMGGMFRWCSSLSTLDLSSFDTSNVTNMETMFAYTSKLATIQVSDKWVERENVNKTNMFNQSGTSELTFK